MRFGCWTKIESVKGCVRLGLCLMMVASICFWVLPMLAKVPAVEARIDFNDSKKIDGNATFYTDQEFLIEMLEERERKSAH